MTRRWHRTATRIDKLRTDMPVKLRPVDKTSRRYACEPEPDAGTVLLHTIDKLIAPLCLLFTILIVLIRQRSTDRMIVPVRLRLTD